MSGVIAPLNYGGTVADGVFYLLTRNRNIGVNFYTAIYPRASRRWLVPRALQTTVSDWHE